MLAKGDLLQVVASDLRYLREKWDHSIDDTSLRISSPILRRLLVEQQLQRAWKVAGFTQEPQITVSSLSAILAAFPQERIFLAAAGGARVGKVEVTSFFGVVGELDLSIVEKFKSSGAPPKETVGLRAFIEAPCIIVQGAPVSRRLLVKYVANKLGGAHHDSSRGTTPEERVFAALDTTLDHVEIAGKNAVYFELLGAGQAVAESEDVGRFLEAVGST